MPNVIFRYGTSQQYNELEKRDASALYFLEDKKEIRKGDDLYAVGRAATQAEDGLMSAADKTKLDGMNTTIDKAIANHTATDAEVSEMLAEIYGE